MKFIKLVKFDLKYGVTKKWYYHLIYLVIVIFALTVFKSRLKAFELSSFTFGDCLAYLFAGIGKYIPRPGEPIRIPYLWLLLCLLPCFFNLRYMYDDVSGLGQYVICRVGKRAYWWVSKCLGNIMLVIADFLIVFAASYFLTVIFNGNTGLNVSQDIVLLIEPGEGTKPVGQWAPGAAELMLEPMFVTAAVSVLQMFLCLVLNPSAAFIITVVIFFSSAYLLSPFLIGNYAMFLRSDTVMDGGMSAAAGFVFAAAAGVFSVAAGTVYFKRYDILGKE